MEGLILKEMCLLPLEHKPLFKGFTAVSTTPSFYVCVRNMQIQATLID